MTIKSDEMYQCLEEALPAVVVSACPVCGSRPALWQFIEKSGTASKVVMCPHGDVIGPQDGIANEGCLLYMPPADFYRATRREAIKHWNEFADALGRLRRKNNCVEHSTLRAAGVTPGVTP